MQKKRLVALVLVLAITLQILSLPLAFAEDSTKPIENEDGTLTLTQEYPAEAEAPILPESITQAGQRYVLDESGTAPAENYEPPKQTFTRSFSSEVPLSGINNLGAYFPATYAIDEGEYQGEIGLDPVNPYTITERYEAFRQQVDRATVLYGLPDNDVTRIPTSQVFEVQSAAAPGATTQATLQLLDVRYEVAGTDHLGLPNNYTAYLTYRGQEEYLELHHYDVTANYSGEIASSAELMATTGVYKPIEEAAAPPVATIEEPATPLAEPGLPLAEIAFAITAAATAGSLIFIFIMRLLPFKVCHRDKNKLKIVQRCRIKHDKDHYIVQVKKNIALGLNDDMYGVLPKRYQDKELMIEVYQDTECVYEGKILPEMPLLNANQVYSNYATEPSAANA